MRQLLPKNPRVHNSYIENFSELILPSKGYGAYIRVMDLWRSKVEFERLYTFPPISGHCRLMMAVDHAVRELHKYNPSKYTEEFFRNMCAGHLKEGM